jgi:hypothetical protein
MYMVCPIFHIFLDHQCKKEHQQYTSTVPYGALRMDSCIDSIKSPDSHKSSEITWSISDEKVWEDDYDLIRCIQLNNQTQNWHQSLQSWKIQIQTWNLSLYCCSVFTLPMRASIKSSIERFTNMRFCTTIVHILSYTLTPDQATLYTRSLVFTKKLTLTSDDILVFDVVN